MAVGGAALTERMGVDSGDIPLEFGVLAGCPVNGKLGVQDKFVIAGSRILGGLSEGRHDELGLRRLEFLAQGLDQANQVLLVPNGMGLDVAVFVALPPGKALDFVPPALPMRKLLVEVIQHLVSGLEAVVVLLAGIPIDGLGSRPFVPGERRLLVAGVDLSLVFKLFAAGGEEVPGKGTVALRRLEDEDGLINVVADGMAEADFRADPPSGNSKRPIARRGYHATVPNVVAGLPLPLLVDQIRVHTLELH